MTVQDIMEEVSKGYIEIIANRGGFFNSSGRDYGTDMTIRKAIVCPNRRRYLTTGKAIDIQLKATSEKYIRNINDDLKSDIKYDLEIKNFNDLVERKASNGYIPLILVVFIFPDDDSSWVSFNNDDLIIKKSAYWYEIPENTCSTENANTITISIPKSNKVGLSLFRDMFSTL